MSDQAPIESNGVLVVDDNSFNRDGVTLYLKNHGYEVYEAGDEAEAFKLAQAHRPRMAVIDIVIPTHAGAKANIDKSVGIHLVRRIKDLDPQAGIVVFSAHEDRGGEVWELVRDGVRGVAYLFKGVRPERLLQALRDTAAGHVILDGISADSRPRLSEEILNRLSPAERPWVDLAVVLLHTLSEREREVAIRLAFSQTNAAIAAALNIAPKTVENHISHVYEKLGFDELEKRAPTLRKSSLLAKACMIYDLANKDIPDR